MNQTIEELQVMIGYIRTAAIMQPKHSAMFNKIADVLTDIVTIKRIKEG